MPDIPPPVIQYHKVADPKAGALVRGGYTPPARFARQLTLLRRRGYRFLTAGELIARYREEGRFPAGALTITFDDGWLDNYTEAFPVLRRLGIPATIFLVPSLLGKTSATALAAGEAPRPHLNPDQVREMAAAGIEFGSHTLTHRLLHELTTEEIRREVVESKRQIEDLLQRECPSFAYPAGYYTAEAQAIVAAAGHSAAFTTSYGPTDGLELYALNRIEILRRHRFLFQFRALLPVL